MDRNLFRISSDDSLSSLGDDDDDRRAEREAFAALELAISSRAASDPETPEVEIPPFRRTAATVPAEPTAAGEGPLTVALTGANGFLGRHVLSTLLKTRGEPGGLPPTGTVRLLDLRLDDELAALGDDETRVELRRCDVIEYDDVRRGVRGADLVIHAAACVDVWGRTPDDLLWAVNVDGTENVTEACRQERVRALVYVSSMEAVGPNRAGDPHVRLDEDASYHRDHDTLYGKSKAAAEAIVLRADGRPHPCRDGRLRTCAVRPTGIYGEGWPLLEDFCRKAVKAGNRLVGGCPPDSEHGRVYAGNAAWMLLMAGRRLLDRDPGVCGQVFYAYDDTPYGSYDDVNALLLDHLGFKRARLPARLLAAAAAVNGWLGRLRSSYRPALTPATLNLVRTSFSVRTDKAQRRMGYVPYYGWDESKRLTQAWLETRGWTRKTPSET